MKRLVGIFGVVGLLLVSIGTRCNHPAVRASATAGEPGIFVWRHGEVTRLEFSDSKAVRIRSAVEEALSDADRQLKLIVGENTLARLRTAGLAVEVRYAQPRSLKAGPLEGAAKVTWLIVGLDDGGDESDAVRIYCNAEAGTFELGGDRDSINRLRRAVADP